jgi:hypothetical protein
MRSSLFIIVNPLGSKFAKSLQTAVIEKTRKKITRARQPTPNRNNFIVTPRVLNKIEQLQRFTAAGVSCPSYCTTPEGVAGLSSKTVFARTLINSTNGRGIVEFERGEAAPRAPLYTAYIPKKKEFRLHVFGDRVIDIQEKRKKREFNNDRDTRVRNVSNGYVYCRDDVQIPEDVAALARNAVSACGYQYGAVDIIWNEKQNKYYVLEVNSRPGLMGTTLDKYANALVEMYRL